MKMITHILLFFLLVTAVYHLSSCERDVTLKFPPHVSQLVLHGYIAVGDTIKVALGKSIKSDMVVDDTSAYVNDGWIVLYENGVFRDSLKLNALQRRYVSAGVVAASGKTYTVKAGAPGFANVEATATAPFPVNTVSLSRTRNARVTTGNVPLDDVVFAFNDPAPEKNYYLTALYPPDGGVGALCVYTYDPAIERYKADITSSFDQNSCIVNNEILYTDKSFNGTRKEITLSAPSGLLETRTIPSTGAVYRSYLKRYHVSEEYYRYFKTRIGLDATTGGPSFNDPVLIKGNVVNGFGLFTVFTVTTDSLP